MSFSKQPFDVHQVATASLKPQIDTSMPDPPALRVLRTPVFLTLFALVLGGGCNWFFDTSEPGYRTESGGTDTGIQVDVRDIGSSDTPAIDTDAGTWDCDSINTSNNAGTACQSQSDCRDGTLCAILDPGETVGTCFQLCAPELCESMCSGAEFCTSIGDPGSGRPATFADGTVQGVCAVPPTGDVGPFGVCDNENFCVAGSQCASFEVNAMSGYCVPDCANGETCPTVGNMESRCVLGPSTSEPTGCAIPCQSGSDCPANLRCHNAGVCVE